MSPIESAPSDSFVNENGSIIVLGLQNRGREVAIKFWDRPGLYQWTRKERYEILELEGHSDIDSMDCYTKEIKKVYCPPYGYVDIKVKVYHRYADDGGESRLPYISVASQGLSRGFARGESL
jgi:hypothetical protein